MWHRLIKNEKSWRVLMVGTLFIGVFWIMANRVPAADPGLLGTAPRPGFSAPPMSLPSLDGTQIDLTSLRGKAVVINFWATWCLPCRAEMPAIERIWRTRGEDNLAILAVNLQEDPTRILAFVQEYDLTFPILLDQDGAAFRDYQVQLYPTTVFIDQEGTIQDIVYGGPMAESLLAAKITELLD